MVLELMLLLAMLGMLIFPSEVKKQEDLSRLLQFRAGSIATLYPSAVSSLSGEISWNPQWFKLGDIEVIGNTGVSFFFPPNGPMFFAPETLILISTSRTNSFSVEAGAGFQYWMNKGFDVYFDASLNLRFGFENKRLGLLDAFVVGYSILNQAPPVHEIKLMAEFTL